MKFDKPLFPQLFKGIALFTPGADLIYCLDPKKQGHWHLHLCVALQEILGLPEPPHFLVPGYTATMDRWLDPRTRQIRTSAEIYPLVRHHQALLNAVFGLGNLVWETAPWQEGLCDPLVLETYRHRFPQLWEDHDLIVRFERPEQFSYSYRESYPRLERKEVSSDNIQGESSASEERTSSPSETTASELPVLSERDAIHLNSIGQEPSVSQELPPEESSTTASFVSVRDSGAIAHNEYPDMALNSHLQHAQGYVLRLFVSGHSAATEYTLISLHQLLEHSLRLPYTLKVIDVFKHPDQAEANQISATPTLLRVWPQPVRRIVGDLTDAERILRILAVPEE